MQTYCSNAARRRALSLQRGGRIIRQGNDNPDAYIYRYVTEDTFDAYMFALLENKQKFIGQIMTSKSPARSIEDVDEGALSYAEIKALCTGNPHIKEYMELEIQLTQLKVLRGNHLNEKHALEDNILRHYPREIKFLSEIIEGYAVDLDTIKAHMPPVNEQAEKGSESKFPGMNIDGKFYHKSVDAGVALFEFCSEMKTPDQQEFGEYMGFKMLVEFKSGTYVATLRGRQSYEVTLGSDYSGNITRISNTINKIPGKIEKAKIKLGEYNRLLEEAKEQVSAPFSREGEYQEKTARLAKLAIELKMGKDEPQIINTEPDEQELGESAARIKKHRDRDSR